MRFILLLLVMLALSCSAGQAQSYALKNDSVLVRIAIPSAVVTSFQRVFPIILTDTLAWWEIQVQATDTLYGVNIGKHGSCGQAAFDAKGVVVESILEIQQSSLPKPVKRKVKKAVIPWLRTSYPEGPYNLRFYAYAIESKLWYYEIKFCNAPNQIRGRHWEITSDGHYYNPKFR